MVFHSTLIYIQLYCYFIIRKAFFAAHDKDFSSLRRHPVDKDINQQGKFFGIYFLFNDIGEHGVAVFPLFNIIFFFNGNMVIIVVNHILCHSKQIPFERSNL